MVVGSWLTGTRASELSACGAKKSSPRRSMWVSLLAEGVAGPFGAGGVGSSNC